jgi:hypothetical protein
MRIRRRTCSKSILAVVRTKAGRKARIKRQCRTANQGEDFKSIACDLHSVEADFGKQIYRN